MPPSARIDALGDAHEDRLLELRGRTLDRVLDDELQTIVSRAAAELGFPMALVSLVLRRTQRFRAHVGLPADLAIAGATDRDVSFCQFVVRDGAAFEVQDAARDARVPQDLVQRYGIRSYLGVPVTVGEAVVGSLCVIDVRQRSFGANERVLLQKLALRVNERLDALSAMDAVVERKLAHEASGIAFGEVRNRLQAVTGHSMHTRISLADLAPLADVADELADSGNHERVLGALRGAAVAVHDLERAQQALERELLALQTAVLSVEPLFNLEGALSVEQTARDADGLAFHYTKLVGGVRWSTEPTAIVNLSRPLVTAAFATALGALARTASHMHVTRGIDVAVTSTTDTVTARFSVPSAPPDLYEQAASHICDILNNTFRAVVRSHSDALALIIGPSASAQGVSFNPTTA